MTGTSSKRPAPPSRPVMVEVVVVVNHDDLRRGERGEVELTEHLRARLDKGYLRLAEEEPYTPEGAAPPGLGATASRRPNLYQTLAVPQTPGDMVGVETFGGGSLLGVRADG